MQVFYTPTFVRQFNSLEWELQIEIASKVEQFKDRKQYRQLKVHKLHGRLAERYSFSVNYRYRVAFVWFDARTAILVAVGDHEIYN